MNGTNAAVSPRYFALHSMLAVDENSIALELAYEAKLSRAIVIRVEVNRKEKVEAASSKIALDLGLQQLDANSEQDWEAVKEYLKNTGEIIITVV